jgi:D-glycero-D-manno-heptose 1,7-bisphosphate phosphatase
MENFRKALFLDRDGVINYDFGHVHEIKKFKFIDGIFDLGRFFQEKGFLIIVITNQAGIAKSYYGHEDFSILNEHMLDEFKKENILISKVYYCPHHEDFTGPCECRKPEPGMILEAAKEFKIDLSKSILIGDRLSDIGAAKNAGIGTSILFNSNMTSKIFLNFLKKVNKFDSE